MGATFPEKVNDIKLLTEDLTVLAFDDNVAKTTASIYHQVRQKNKMIGFRDIFIAATCMVNHLPVITLNKKHFERVEVLKSNKLPFIAYLKQFYF